MGSQSDPLARACLSTSSGRTESIGCVYGMGIAPEVPSSVVFMPWIAAVMAIPFNSFSVLSVSSALGGLCVGLEVCLLGQVGMFGDNVHFRIYGQSRKHTELGLCSKPPLFPMLPSQATGNPTLAIVTNHHPVHQCSSSPAPFPALQKPINPQLQAPCSFLVALAPQGYTQDSRERSCGISSSSMHCGTAGAEPISWKLNHFTSRRLHLWAQEVLFPVAFLQRREDRKIRTAFAIPETLPSP